MLQKKTDPAACQLSTPRYDFGMDQGQFNEACGLVFNENKNKSNPTNT
jgi:hypothetical protein